MFYILNKTCYHGLWRVNSSGEFNVPYGFYKNPRIETDLTAWAKTAENWQFTVGNYRDIRVLPDDFLYVDPPHDNGFTQYTTEGFTIWDQRELADWLAALNNPMIVSNAATERMVNMYKYRGFHTFVIQASRGFGSSKPELVAIKGMNRANTNSL